MTRRRSTRRRRGWGSKFWRAAKRAAAHPATQSIVSAMSAGAVVLLKKKLGLNTEKHWLDTLETNVATASTASVMANPMVIPQGDTVNTRNGNTVRMTSLVLKGRIQANTAATAGCLVY